MQEKRTVTERRPRRVAFKPPQEPLCGHGDPRDSAPWSRMAFSGKGAQWARNRPRYVPGPLAGKFGGSATSLAGQPACGVAGRTAPTHAPRTAANSRPGGNRRGSPGFQLLSAYLQGERICIFPPKTLLSWIPPDSPFPIIDLTQEGRYRGLILCYDTNNCCIM